MTKFFKDPINVITDSWHQAKPQMLTFGGFPLFLFANEALLQKVGITDHLQSIAIEMVLFSLYALVMHTAGNFLFDKPKQQQGYERLKEGEAPSIIPT